MRMDFFDSDKVPEDIKEDTGKLSKDISSRVMSYIETSKLPKLNLRLSVCANALMGALSSLMCSIYHHDKSNLKDFGLELEKYSDMFKEMCLNKYKWRIERDLRGEDKNEVKQNPL